MQKSVKSRAEEKFAAIQKKSKQALTEREEQQQERAELTAKLRALRLAKEAADKKAAKTATESDIDYLQSATAAHPCGT